MLHVANQGVVPIDEIQTAVRSDLQVTGAKIAIGSLNQILAEFAFDLSGIFDRVVLLDT